MCRTCCPRAWWDLLNCFLLVVRMSGGKFKIFIVAGVDGGKFKNVSYLSLPWMAGNSKCLLSPAWIAGNSKMFSYWSPRVARNSKMFSYLSPTWIPGKTSSDMFRQLLGICSIPDNRYQNLKIRIEIIQSCRKISSKKVGFTPTKKKN